MGKKGILLLSMMAVAFFASGVSLYSRSGFNDGGSTLSKNAPDINGYFRENTEALAFEPADDVLPTRLYLQPDGAMSVTPYSRVQDQDVYVNGHTLEWKCPVPGDIVENEFRLTLIGGSQGIYGTVFLAELLLKTPAAGEVRIDTTSFIVGPYYSLSNYNPNPRIMDVLFDGANPRSQTGDTLIVRLRVFSGAAGKIMYGTSAGFNVLQTVSAYAPVLRFPPDGSQDQPLILNLEWNPVEGAVRYDLEVSGSSDFTTYQYRDSSVIATSKQIRGLTVSSMYYWRVRAGTSFGWSAWSSIWKFKTLGEDPPEAPILVAPVDGAQELDLMLNLTWQSPDRPDGYHLQLSQSAQFESCIINNSTLTSSSMFLSGLKHSTDYFWRVRAKNQYGWGPWSGARIFTTFTPSAEPRNLIASAGNSCVALVWHRSPDPKTEHYRIYMRTEVFDRMVVDSATGGISDTTRIINGLLNGTRYFFSVTAVAGTGKESGMSNEADATPIWIRTTFHQPENNLGIESPAGRAGFAWGDYNRDGFTDLFLSGSDQPSVIYRNTGSRFVSIPFTEDSARTTGAVWADFNGDAFQDLLVTDGNSLDLYQGNGEGQFTKITESANLDHYFCYGKSTLMISSADFDRDGDLDIVFAGGDSSPGPVQLLNNEDGRFSDVAETQISPNRQYESWNPAWVDVDNDGDVDLFIPTIRTTGASCALYINHSGRLDETPGTESGIKASSAITSAWGDYNNDGYMDLLVVPYFNDNDGGVKLYRNDRNGSFTDVAAGCGLDFVYSDARGVCWGDYDNDGRLDLLIARMNGEQLLFQNNGDRFEAVGPQAGVNISHSGCRSGMFVDYNNDGCLDILLARENAVKALFQNNAENQNNWIGIVPVGIGMNISAIGARIVLYSDGQIQIRDIQAGSGGMTNGDLRAHFGIGPSRGVDSAQVAWPNGRTETYTGLFINQYITLRQTDLSGTKRSEEKTPFDFRFQNNYPNPFNPSTILVFSVAQKMFVSIKVYDVTGKEVAVVVSENLQPGIYERHWAAEGMPSGVYLCRMQAGSFASTRKITLFR